jgi:ubiquinone/menaquinone biosynthesis C-methylase UbiE
MWEEATARIPSLLRDAGMRLDEATILDVGCGWGSVLGRLVQYGARPERLYGVDVQQERIAQAQAQYPGMNLRYADAQHLGFASQWFDAILCINLFGSILDGLVAQTVAAEVRRVVRPTGVIIWCDIRYPNPWNPNVRGYSRQRIRRLFPSCRIALHPITVLPPLARRLGRWTPVFYPRLARMSFLCVRYLGTIRPGAENTENAG